MDEGIYDLNQLKNKLKPRTIGIVIVVILFLVMSYTSFYTVDQKESAVILRFGKYDRTSGPGLHFKMPFGMEVNYNVPTQLTLKEEFGFRTEVAGVRTTYSDQNFLNESIMLTGDLNIIDVEWIIQYTIKDPRKWLFNLQEPITTIRDISRSAINELVGDRTIFDVIGNQRTEIEDQSRLIMNRHFKLYGLGINVETVKLQNIVPPKGTVQDAFEDVNKAIQDRNRMINEGKEAYNNDIPKARGEAERTVQEAEGYAVEKVNLAKGDVSRFLAVLGEYKKNPKLTRDRLYYDMFDEVFKGKSNIELIDKNLKNFLNMKSFSKKGEKE